MRVPESFDHPDWIFEPKYDGFHAVARVEGHRCTLTSRNGHMFKSWSGLCGERAQAFTVRRAVLDGELVCLEPDGRSTFRKLLFRRQAPCFAAFGLLYLDGTDLRELPLVERKRRLRRIISPDAGPALFVEHIDTRGVDF